MQLLVRAFPVLAGQEEQMRRFADDVRTTRAVGMADMYRRYGIARESWHLQETPHGTWVIAVTQIPEKPVDVAGEEYAGSREDFDMWFKTQVLTLTGIDPQAAPLGPPTQCIFDSMDI